MSWGFPTYFLCRSYSRLVPGLLLGVLSGLLPRMKYKVADPSLPNGLEERGSGDLHRLNAQGGSQGLPPWWSPLTTRGAREGTCNLGLRFNALFSRLKGVYEGAPALLNPFDLRT